MSKLFDDLDLSNIEKEQAFLSNKTNTSNNSNFMDKLLKLPDGAGFAVIRILPPKPKQKFCCRTRTHTLKSQFMDRGRNFHCIRSYNEETGKWEGDCPICAYWNDIWYKIRRTPEGMELNKLKKEATDIKPVERYYFNALSIASKPATGQSIEDGPLIYSCGKIVYTKIINGINGDKQNEVPALGNITHPTTGRNFKIIKTIKPGEEKWPEYAQSTFLEVSKIGTDEKINEWLGAMHDLQALRQLRPAEELMHALRVYKGKEKDRKTSFDLSELEEGTQMNASAKSEGSEVAVIQAKSTTKKVNVDDDPDLALADDPFIKDMNDFVDE